MMEGEVKKDEMITWTIDFLDTENVGLAVKISVPAYLETKILQNVHLTAAIL